MANVLLIDSDILVYRAGFAAESKKYVVQDEGMPDTAFDDHKKAVEWLHNNSSEHATIKHEHFVQPVENALQNTRSCIEKIQNHCGFDRQELYLSGKNNFRHDMATIKVYKGNRSAFAKPVHYKAIRDYLVDRWDAKVIDGWEADDEIGIRTSELVAKGDNPIVVTIDKDLDMLVAYHYNWVKDIGYVVDERQAKLAFFTQLLTGDSTDNIPGIAGVGPVTAAKILAGKGSPKAMLHAVWEAWKGAYPNGVERHDGTVMETKDALLEVARLVWIKQDRSDKLWDSSFVT